MALEPVGRVNSITGYGPGQRHMIAARWADAEGGGFRWDSHSANTQGESETTVTAASKALNVGERGVFHTKNVLENGTPEEIAAANSRAARG